MKKISTLLILLMMFISISSLALADEAGEEQDHDDETQEQKDVDIDNETEKEIFVMNNSLGAEIRLLQLQKALLKNILKGNMTIEVLRVLGFNTTALEEILDQMKEVLEEVKAANTSSNESVQIFVELKNQSKNLTTQFRETIKELLDDVTLQELREMIKENLSEQLQDLDKNIRNKIRHFNRNQLYRVYGLIGEVNDSFIAEYLNGNVTLNLTKIQLCKVINQLTAKKRYLIFSEIKEDNIKGKIHAQAIIDEMKNKGKGKGHGNDD
jgi:hypothetical protein